MDLDLFETPGTKKVTKSKKRRSVRIRRKSSFLGLGPHCDEDKTNDACPVESHSQDVSNTDMASGGGQSCGGEDSQVSRGNQYGSVWMDTDSPEMAELVNRRNRRKSRVHLPIMTVIEGPESPCALVDPDIVINDHHLSVELSRTGDITDNGDSVESNGISSRLSGSYIVAQSPVADTSGTTVPEHQDLIFNQQQETDCGSAANSFSEYLPCDNSSASLSPCFEASDYNVGRMTFQNLNSSSQQNQEAEASTYSQSRTLIGTTQDLTSSMTPVDKKGVSSSDFTSSLTPYSPSQPVFKNISPPNCESPNSTFSPVYLTPSDKVTRSKVNMDSGNDDEDIWKTCKKTIAPETDRHVGLTPGTNKTKAVKSTQKKSSISKSTSKVPSKQQTSGFLSICRSLAGKLASAVRHSPSNEQGNPMPSSDDTFTSVKPTNTSNESAEKIVNSSGINSSPVVSVFKTDNNNTAMSLSMANNTCAIVSVADNSETGTTVSTPGNLHLLSTGDGENLSNISSCDRNSDQTLPSPSSMKFKPSSLPLPHDKVDGFCEGKNISPIRPLQDGEIESVEEAVRTDDENLSNFSDTRTNHKLCSSTAEINTSEITKSDSKDTEDIKDFSSSSVCTISQSKAPKCSDQVNTQHLEACFDYVDSKPVQETPKENISDLGSQTGLKSVALESAELGNVVESLDSVDITDTSKAASKSDKVRKVKTKQKRTGRKSMGLVSKKSPSCELSESVNKLSLNTVSDMDTCEHVGSTDSNTECGLRQKDSESSGNNMGALFTVGVNSEKKGHTDSVRCVNPLSGTKEQSTTHRVGDMLIVEDQPMSQNSINNKTAVTLSNTEVKKDNRSRKVITNTLASVQKGSIHPPNMEGDQLASLPPENVVKKRGRSKKSEKVAEKMTCTPSEPGLPCVGTDPIPSASVVKKRGRTRKSMNFIPPVEAQETSDVHISSEKGSELQETSTKQLVNGKPENESASLQSDVSDDKQPSGDSIKVLTVEDLKALDEYLGIEEPVVVPPPKKRGRSRKSVGGCEQTKSAVQEEVNKNIGVDKSTTDDMEQSPSSSQVDGSGATDGLVKDPLVAELEDLELLERRPKRKSSRIQRRSIEIYRQTQTTNTASDDVPMSPLEIEEESKQTAAVLQDVSRNHGNARNNQDSTTKIVRKRKVTKNEPSIEDIYKNKNFKRPAPKIWETIYETPTEEQIFSKKRLRRSIMFDESLIVPPAKTKLRLRKAVKNGMDPRQRRKKMLSDATVKRRLAKMEAILENDD